MSEHNDSAEPKWFYVGELGPFAALPVRRSDRTLCGDCAANKQKHIDSNLCREMPSCAKNNTAFPGQHVVFVHKDNYETELAIRVTERMEGGDDD